MKSILIALVVLAVYSIGLVRGHTKGLREGRKDGARYAINAAVWYVGKGYTDAGKLRDELTEMFKGFLS